uniref:Uncharacterized protein n=1 Tax=Coccolithus braarudii TaxID=221442 RepID=A0A7S0Q4A6_9EUKA|mmetsp:Transcript_35784/g.76398  ORF Transcript_35784/g.76398 Transcript_35784/m.76398 type:complete len:212 (+) Transcript_35784:65-700(+)
MSVRMPAVRLSLCCLLWSTAAYQPLSHQAAVHRLPFVTRALRLSSPLRPEFCRPFDTSGLKKYAKVSIAATAEECSALAQRFELERLESLEANVTLHIVDRSSRRLHAKGTLSARNVQRCDDVVGEMRILQLVDALFETYFVPEDTLGLGPVEVGDSGDYDEPMQDDEIDLGELCAQHFYLQLVDLVAEEATEEWGVADGTVVFDWTGGES